MFRVRPDWLSAISAWGDWAHDGIERFPPLSKDFNPLSQGKRGFMNSILQEFWTNFTHNLFKPILLFFYMGFLVPILGVKLDFPHVIYQGLTIFLLIAIGWHGGEELATLTGSELSTAGGFMAVGVVTNFFVGITAYMILRACTKLRRVDAATVAGYYGSDSAGTFATAVGVLVAAQIAYAPYMPVMLAVMEIPGCLVALYLVSTLRHNGMDPNGNMPDEAGYDPKAKALRIAEHEGGHGHEAPSAAEEVALLTVAGEGEGADDLLPPKPKSQRMLSPELLHEVFFNPGIYLLMAGIVVGFVSGKQGKKVTAPDDALFINLFQGMLCLFLLEMGMTASSKLKDLRAAGWPFILYGILAPNLYATIGIIVAHGYAMAIHQHFDTGTYVLFAVLCGASSYIAVPAVQRLAIPEASPTLPLAASLGLTFSYNVTIGIPIYIQIAKLISEKFPV